MRLLFSLRLPEVNVTPAKEFLVTIQEADFDIGQLQATLLAGAAEEGAVATFTGYVRADKQAKDIRCMELEHYPGMTEKSIEGIMALAGQRWPLLAARVVHRVGKLYPGDQIVWVGVSSAHRDAAFSACDFIMDYLKTEAPLWKKEFNAQGALWVEAKKSDTTRAGRWSTGGLK
jgi:molybdopterin synthase catalytic subunit